MTFASLHGMDALRILCGIWFLPHIVGKTMNYTKAAGTFEAAGFRPGTFFVGFTIGMEIIASVSLVFGIAPKIGALFALLVLAGAAYAVVKINGFHWRWQKMGPEFPVFWALACAVTLLE